MPSLGADMDVGTVLEWLVRPGDTVHRGDIVAVVKTDKADIEVEIFDDGVIGELLVSVGTEVEVGAPLATVLAPGAPTAAAPERETAPEVEPEPAPVPAPAPAPAPPPAPEPRRERTIAERRVEPSATDRISASPYARRRAAELGIDLATVTAAQPGRPVTAADVERAGVRAPVDQAEAMRRAIGALMARSKREIPHYYLEHPVQLSHTLAWLTRHNESVSIEQRVLPAALLYRAVAVAARRIPELNGFWQDDRFVPGSGVHLGVAIALRGGGLVAPAIHDADQMPLGDLMTSLRDLTARARGGRLRASEMTDATITVTNLGDQGTRTVFGVIYPPQVALVGFGRIAELVWAEGGNFAIRPVVTATLAADHRASDGHVGARFLTLVERLLHEPEEL